MPRIESSTDVNRFRRKKKGGVAGDILEMSKRSRFAKSRGSRLIRNSVVVREPGLMKKRLSRIIR